VVHHESCVDPRIIVLCGIWGGAAEIATYGPHADVVAFSVRRGPQTEWQIDVIAYTLTTAN
jgi:hypothetical protein